MTPRGVLQGLRIASPFALLALGFWALISSPWPAIWRLMLKGQHVEVIAAWPTVGLAAVTIVCFAAAIILSLGIRWR